MPLSKERDRIKKRLKRGGFCFNCDLAVRLDSYLVCSRTHSLVLPRYP